MTWIRLAAALGIVAVLWKLGDAPCGCAAHNRWVETFTEYGGHGPDGHGEHGHGNESDDDEERHPFLDHGCIGSSCPVYVPGVHVAAPDAPAEASLVDLVDCNVDPAAAREAWAHRPHRGTVDATSTGKLRAALQILLI